MEERKKHPYFIIAQRTHAHARTGPFGNHRAGENETNDQFQIYWVAENQFYDWRIFMIINYKAQNIQ